MIKITLPGDPIAKERPRFSKHGTYDPQKNQKHAAKFQVLDQLGQYKNLPFPSDVPIQVEIYFYFSIPKDQDNLYSWGLLNHVKKPDYDNTEKFILDVLSGIVYQDDKQVHKSRTEKLYSENPRTEIYIVPKKSECSDKVKEVLSMISTHELGSISEYLSTISQWLLDNENPYHLKDDNIDYEEIALIILEFAEKHADSLKKINKKFPGLAKELKEKIENN